MLKSREIKDLKSQLAECRQQNNQISSLLKAIDRSMATIEFEPDGTILTANDNFSLTMGYDLAEIKGQHHRIFCTKEYVNSPEYIHKNINLLVMMQSKLSLTMQNRNPLTFI